MTIDLTFLRILFTVVAFATFAGLVAWAWTRGRHDGFADAAALPFAAGTGQAPHGRGDA